MSVITMGGDFFPGTIRFSLSTEPFSKLREGNTHRRVRPGQTPNPSQFWKHLRCKKKSSAAALIPWEVHGRGRAGVQGKAQAAFRKGTVFQPFL